MTPLTSIKFRNKLLGSILLWIMATTLCVHAHSPGGTPVVVTLTVTNALTVGAAGTIDCAKTAIFPAPVSGTAKQHTLVVTVNVTTVGCFTPITVSGSGMSVANGITQICTTTTGVQKLHIPVYYDGTALGTLNFTVGSSGTCSANLSTVTPKKVIQDMWVLDNCTLTVAGPTLK